MLTVNNGVLNNLKNRASDAGSLLAQILHNLIEHHEGVLEADLDYCFVIYFQKDNRYSVQTKVSGSKEIKDIQRFDSLELVIEYILKTWW